MIHLIVFVRVKKLSRSGISLNDLWKPMYVLPTSSGDQNIKESVW